MPEYAFDNAAAETEQRFSSLEVLYDPITIRHLDSLVGPGSHSLEVGGGSGSIARWMSERVGANGRVLVTDINTRFLDGIATGNIEVRQHDIASDPIEESAFDIAHTRLVLIHEPARERAVEQMISALKPGGWLVLQEFESLSMRADLEHFPGEHLLKTYVASQAVLMRRGADLRFGRKLPPLLRSLGMINIEAEGHTALHQGGTEFSRLMRANFLQVRDDMLAAGDVTADEIEADLARLDDPGLSWPSMVLWTVRAQKP